MYGKPGVRLFESLPPFYDSSTDLAVAWGLLVHLANQLDFSSTAFLSECPRESEGCTRSLTRCFYSAMNPHSSARAQSLAHLAYAKWK